MDVYSSLTTTPLNANILSIPNWKVVEQRRLERLKDFLDESCLRFDTHIKGLYQCIYHYLLTGNHLNNCRRMFTCPSCSSYYLWEHRQDIQSLLRGMWKSGDYSVIFETLTIPHSPGQRLDTLLNHLKETRKATYNNDAWKQIRRNKYVFDGKISALEITVNLQEDKADWHPHHHNLLFFHGNLSDSEFQSLSSSLTEIWSDSYLKARRKLDSTRSNFRNVNSQAIKHTLLPFSGNDREVEAMISSHANYMTKMEDKNSHSHTFLSLLDQQPSDLVEKCMREFLYAIHRKQRIKWSAGLRGKFPQWL